MDFKNQIYLLTHEAQTERQVRSALEPEHHFTLAGVCREMEQLRALMDKAAAGLVLVDVDPEPLERVADLMPLVNQYMFSRFVILTRDVSGNLVLRAMQAGVRHVQAKDGISSELPGVLHDLAPDSPLGGSQGLMLTVLSASGGCGTTTLAVNAANEIQMAVGHEVLLVDLDYDYGAVASYLELHNPYGIAEVLAHRDVIDYHLIRSTAVRYAERLHALLSPASVNGMTVPPLRAEKLEQALRACRHAYAMTVVDAPRVGLDVAATLARSSEAVWIVLQPAVKDIRMTKALRAGLEGRGVPSDRIRVVVNRYKKSRQMISVEEIQKALRDVPLALLSNDYASVIRGINYGQPLSQAAPRCLLRRNLLDLVAPLAEQLALRFKEQRWAQPGAEAGGAEPSRGTGVEPGLLTGFIHGNDS